MELLVVAGADAGNQFTLEGDEVLIGRGQPQSGQTRAIRLEDKSISRHQAWIRRDASDTWIVHIQTASNPTRINGRQIDRARLIPGDRIEMGRVTIEVHARDGTNLSGFTEIMEDAARESTQPETSSAAGRAASVVDDPTAPVALPEGTTGASNETTEVRPMQVKLGELEILRGAAEDDPSATRIHSVGMTPTRIGRSREVDIRIAEPGVSRLHAEIAVDSGRLVLRAKSETNPTLVNGFPVLDQIELSDGDEIQLADRVVLGLRLLGPGRAKRPFVADSPAGLSSQMQKKIDLDRTIDEFNVMGTFLDVDVVASRSMKGGSARAEHIIVSFERFRNYVGSICQEWDGQVLNSNGDELMCFFESAESAILAGSAMLERLADFNRDLNLLSQAFRFRIGAHSGASLVDLDAGIAYSEVLDTAGHIQKRAEPDTLVISADTLEALPRPVPVTSIGELTGVGETRLLYRVDGPVRRSHFETEGRS